MERTELRPNLSVGPQITTDNLTLLAAEGFTDVVCNRPDAEHPEGPGSGVMVRAANFLGLTFHYLPILPNEEPEAQAVTLARILARPGARVFAYCRSGARSTKAWALAGALQAQVTRAATAPPPTPFHPRPRKGAP